MEKITWEEFKEDFEHEITFTTHNLCNPTHIFLGLWKGKRVALKRGKDLGPEMEIMKKIVYHPNIVEFLGDIEGDILMEGIKNGLTIKNYCRWSPGQCEVLSIKTCIGLMKQLANALKHLHDKGIIHHDLKGENILVNFSQSGDEPILKLCDFGISEVVDQNGHGKEENREFGTYSSMAPEQKNGRKDPITAKIDVYAFGGLCSSILFKGRKLDQVLYCCPIALNKFIEKCKEDDPNERPTMDAILNFLNQPDLDTSPDYKTLMTQVYGEYQEKGLPIPKDVSEFYEKATSC